MSPPDAPDSSSPAHSPASLASGGAAEAAGRRGTLVLAGDALGAARRELPVARDLGPPAEEARLRARVAHARAIGDAEGERAAAVALIRRLVSNDREPSSVEELARRALELGDDPELRAELASWLAGLGEPARAAATLRPLVKPDGAEDAARVLVLIGVLLARADDATGALRAFEQASVLDVKDAVALELAAALSSWAPNEVSGEVAARAYLEAASRRERAGDVDSVFEDLLRAFGLAPELDAAATRLAASLAALGRGDAADEVKRVHARALAEIGGDGPARARAVHVARMDEALANRAPAQALAAALDAGLDGVIDGPDAARFDELLGRVGIAELVDARKRARDDVAAGRGRDRADLERELAELAPRAAGPNGAADAASMLVIAARLSDARARAEALDLLSSTLPAALRAATLATAASTLASLGDLVGARVRAERACNADPSFARAAAELATIVAAQRDKTSQQAIERALSSIVPTASMCEALATAFEEKGDRALALAWTQRWLVLRPGDPRAVAQLFRCASAAGDAERLGSALDWLFAHGAPLALVRDAVARALCDLADASPSLGKSYARRALDAYGPLEPALRATIDSIATRFDDRALRVAVLERWVAAAPAGEARVEALLTLADRRQHLGDSVGELYALLEAGRVGATPARMLARVPASAPESPDARVAWLACRAEALAATRADDPAEAIAALRALGAARWDRAEDAQGAALAWISASKLDRARGVERLAVDLVSFGGPRFACDTLLAVAEACEDQREAAHVLIAAATIALESDEPGRALPAVEQASLLDPRRAEVLALAERAAESVEAAETLDGIYHRVARAALGRYGRRAAHYRGATRLDRRGRPDLALVHAIAAFEQVPTEGTAFAMLARLASRSDGSIEAVRAVERVADAAGDGEARAAWLKRAATLAGTGDDGLRQRIDVLLRALVARPDVETVVSLFDDVRTLTARIPDEREMLDMRVRRAAKAIFPKLDGPEGARVAIAIAHGALSGLAAPGLAGDALVRAIEADGDVDEFETLSDLASTLAADADAARRFVDKVVKTAGQPYASLGKGALKLASVVATALGDATVAAQLVVEAAKRTPDDDSLAEDAESLLAEAGEEGLTALSSPPPAVQPGEDVVSRASALEATAPDEAIALVLRALELPPTSDESHRALVALARRMLVASARTTELESLLTREIDAPLFTPAERASFAAELGHLALARGDEERALDLLTSAMTPDADASSIDALLRIARARSAPAAVAAALAARVARTSDPRERVHLLCELAHALERAGDRAGSLERWNEVVALEPANREGAAALERAAADRGDYETLARLLGARAANASSPEEKRVLGLRRAAVLEQRLGRLDDARAELVRMLDETGDHPGALRFLADLHERLGEPMLAAPLWLRAATHLSSEVDRAHLAARAANAFLEGGDVAGARKALDEMVATGGAREDRIAQLRVDVERKAGDTTGLVAALDALARVSPESDDHRAALLFEAAAISHAAGDVPGALGRAEAASRLAPSLFEAIVHVHFWAWLARSAAANAEAAPATIEALTKLASAALEPETGAKRAWVLAEALDAVRGGGAGLAELEAREADLGPRGLVALGIADRLAAGGSFATAASFYGEALRGELHGVRRRAEVALSAAGAASRAGEHERALAWLDEAAIDEGARARAERLRTEIATARLASSSRETLEDLAKRTTGVDYARVNAQLARLLAASGDRDDEARADRLFSAAIGAAAADAPLRVQLERERDLLRGSTRTSRPPPQGGDVTPTPIVSIASAAAALAGAAHVPTATPKTPAAVDETTLRAAFESGSDEAGDELARLLRQQPGRARELAALRHALAQRSLGDALALTNLRDAAVAAGEAAWAEAIDHVALAFHERAPAPPAPPLWAQADSPENVTPLVFGGLDLRLLDALALICEGAPQMFRKEQVAFAKSGLARVAADSRAVLGKVYARAARLLGLAEVAVYYAPSAELPRASVALLSPPAVVVAGDCAEESARLRYELGRGLVAAMPECALVLGMSEERSRQLFDAVFAAYGPPEKTRGTSRQVAVLAEMLWQSLPPKIERRLKTVCAEQPRVEGWEHAARVARFAARRAGFFVSGDLAVALHATMEDEQLALDVPLEAPGGLAAACAAHPAIADLVRLAIRPELAVARWRTPGPGEREPVGGGSVRPAT